MIDDLPRMKKRIVRNIPRMNIIGGLLVVMIRSIRNIPRIGMMIGIGVMMIEIIPTIGMMTNIMRIAIGAMTTDMVDTRIRIEAGILLEVEIDGVLMIMTMDTAISRVRMNSQPMIAGLAMNIMTKTVIMNGESREDPEEMSLMGMIAGRMIIMSRQDPAQEVVTTRKEQIQSLYLQLVIGLQVYLNGNNSLKSAPKYDDCEQYIQFIF